MTVRVKICGVRTFEDAEHACRSGADLLGFNLVPSSPRVLDAQAVRELVSRLRQGSAASNTELVGVVANFPGDLLELLAFTGLDSLQLHGSEEPEQLLPLSSRGYKAARIFDVNDVAEAERFGGRRLLVDAKVKGQLGGTGARFDWSLLGPLLSTRDLILAGGLDPNNVANAVRTVRPWAVDVASGVELRPGVKDPALVERFISDAKAAAL
jgi:phosphoribosylanthranilate isomerase